MKTKEQNKINIVYSFQYFLVLTTKINMYDNVGLGSGKVILNSMFSSLCKSSMKVIFTPVPAPKQN